MYVLLDWKDGKRLEGYKNPTFAACFFYQMGGYWEMLGLFL
jgi:hypothetical protein